MEAAYDIFCLKDDQDLRRCVRQGDCEAFWSCRIDLFTIPSSTDRTGSIQRQHDTPNRVPAGVLGLWLMLGTLHRILRLTAVADG